MFESILDLKCVPKKANKA